MNEDTWEVILISNDSSHNWVDNTHQSWFCFECGILKIGVYRASEVPLYEYKRTKGNLTRFIGSCDEEQVKIVLNE